MKVSDINRIADLFASVGSKIPVCPHEWRELQMDAKRKKTPGQKLIDGLTHAVAYARIDALWRRTKKKQGGETTTYDWGYRDGLMAARELFGTEVTVSTKSIGKVDKKALAKGKIKPVEKGSVSAKIGRKAKADRTVKGLKANREKRK